MIVVIRILLYVIGLFVVVYLGIGFLVMILVVFLGGLIGFVLNFVCDFGLCIVYCLLLK